MQKIEVYDCDAIEIKTMSEKFDTFDGQIVEALLAYYKNNCTNENELEEYL